MSANVSTLNARSVLGAVEFDRLLVRSLGSVSSPPQFDLSRFSMITPGVLTQLAALCHYLIASSRRPTILVRDIRVRSYLTRAGFVSAVESVADFEPPMLDFGSEWPPTQRGHSRTLLQLTHLHTIEQLTGVLDRVWQTLQDCLRFPPGEARDLVKVVSELGQNTVEHAGSCGGFIAMQVYNAAGRQFLELGVADSGPGLSCSLRQNAKYRGVADDCDAVDMATTLGISRFDDATRGTGLYHLLRLAEKHRARVRIRTGRVAACYRMDLPRRRKVPVAWAPGVLVTLGLTQRDAN